MLVSSSSEILDANKLVSLFQNISKCEYLICLLTKQGRLHWDVCLVHKCTQYPGQTHRGIIPVFGHVFVLPYPGVELVISGWFRTCPNSTGCHCPVLNKIRHQTMNSMVRRCLLVTIFSTLCYIITNLARCLSLLKSLGG